MSKHCNIQTKTKTRRLLSFGDTDLYIFMHQILRFEIHNRVFSWNIPRRKTIQSYNRYPESHPKQFCESLYANTDHNSSLRASIVNVSWIQSWKINTLLCFSQFNCRRTKTYLLQKTLNDVNEHFFEVCMLEWVGWRLFLNDSVYAIRC